MDLNSGVLLAVVFAMVANQLIMRVAGLKARREIFWGLQGLNIVIGTLVIVVGLPGFEGMPVVRWFIGLLFFFRTVVNNNARLKWLAQEREDAAEEVDEQRDALLSALRKGDAEDNAKS